MTTSRVLISAYGCGPNKGSEQGVGWNWCLQLGRFADVVVLTRSNNQSAIEAALPPELRANIRFEFYDLPPHVGKFKRAEKGLYFYYLMWQWGAYQTAKRLIHARKFDYVMHLTFGSLWMPTFMHRLPISFIWGPIGGGEAVPFKLIGELPSRSRLMQFLRYVLIRTLPLNLLVMGVVRRSTVILARTNDTAKLIPAQHAHKVRIVLETAISEEVLSVVPDIDQSSRESDDFLRVIFTGRLVGLKNVAAALHAVRRARDFGVKLKFQIVGDGPLRPDLERLSAKLEIESLVEFVGAVSQAEVLQRLRNSDVYLFPSLKEGGVWSLMEAMAVGLPVVCVKTSGMEVITDEASAIRVVPESQDQMIEGFATALLDLSRSTSLRSTLGANARHRIEKHFRWEHKADFMQSLFRDLNSRSQ